MGNRREGVDELKALGNQHTKYVFDYNPDVLEKIPNKHDDRDYFVKFNCPEFTSLCPKTGQPDFATIYISYIPDKYIVRLQKSWGLSRGLCQYYHDRLD